MRLGTCILIVPQRKPLILAKELATLDVLSEGRLELGLGAGWLQGEYERAIVRFNEVLSNYFAHELAGSALYRDPEGLEHAVQDLRARAEAAVA